MHILPFKALFPNMELIPSPDYFFATVREEFPSYFQSGFFHQTPADGFYLYQIEDNRRSYLGLVACVDLADYASGAIRQHEQTLADQEQKQMQLALHRKAGVKPVLLTYPNQQQLDHWMHHYIATYQPLINIAISSDGQQHRIWAVQNAEDITSLRQLFLQLVPVSYIADGHHRIAAASLMHQKLENPLEQDHYGTLIAAFFADSELEILDFNRVVEALTDISAARFMALLSQYFEIECLAQAQKPTQKHELTMLLQKDWYRLRWKSHILQSHNSTGQSLDAALFNEFVLSEILGIQNVRNDARVEYVEGPKGLDGLRKKASKSEHSVAFCLYPIQMTDLFALADAHEMLPPKSTWFEPRMKNGMLVQPF